MKKIKKSLLTAFTVLLISSNLLTPTVSAASYTNAVPFSRGSCTELVNAGKLPPGSCGYIGKKPKGGTIRLNKEQWNCVINTYSGAFEIAIAFLSGGGAVIPFSIWKTINSCQGL